VFNNLMI